ncbi:MAG: hypothetical protein HOC41_00855 [Candidatus Marinimicrobia bacterium]|jgi:hypothetical protein|nr:hypothetical protein [Candidatus Neomarinimicrobiota bacterium]MBT3945999.1 hypothetical protein [Candidatus Neomarinimicrobiota bacterium]MBT4154779.1 hypothetical protein [Candidatus Neomarinimicrobiota bacterium]MBT4554216.1 hypothetical protein [Candidatus Neomarinimicrobiota bacterium]MBT4753788.1 hypothetical protein [Candidatus Neomarinimicrobiota bacterium]|tara:strand:- start:4739 stop:4936 length:198 start_codon:yes stop_codon:yes gene_type:complete
MEILQPDIWVTDDKIVTASMECFYDGKDLTKDAWVAGKINLTSKINTILLDGDYPYLYQIFPILN